MARQFTKRVVVTLFGTFSALAFAGAAQAACNGGVCYSGSHATHPAYNPPALSSWSHKVSAPTYSNQSAYGSSSINYGSSTYSSGSYSSVAPCPSGSTKQADGTCLSTSSSSYSSSVYSSTPSYRSSSASYGSVASPSYASQTYGSGSISSTYSDYSTAPLTNSVLSGLGTNESLHPTNCPVSVHNPGGARVLGCFNVVKPKPVVRAVPTVYQVVRPVVYVRYPVPVCNTCCTPETIASRYGSANFGGGIGGSNCGW